jgi:hypothetical protein
LNWIQNCKIKYKNFDKSFYIWFSNQTCYLKI